MTLPRPFVYPTSPHPRRHGPAGYEDYDSFKDWLRDEFGFRCALLPFPRTMVSERIDELLHRSCDTARRRQGRIV